MVTRETHFGIFASGVLVSIALSLVACGDSKRGDGARGNDSGGSGGSSGSTGSGGSDGGSRGGSNGVGGATGGSSTGGSAAAAGSGADAGMAGAGGTGDAGGGGAGGEEERASFYWIEATEEHRQRAASSTKSAFLRTAVFPPYDAPVLIGTSDLIIGETTEEFYGEGFVWTEATGTIALGGLPGANPNIAFSVLSDPRAISADGSVVVGAAKNSQNSYSPFRWTRADGMEAISEDGHAVAVSADGSVVLGVQGQEVFLWTRALGAVTIMLEPLAGDDAIRVLALSADGTAVLGQSFRNDETVRRLFVWTEGSGVRAVENLPGYPSCLLEHARPSGSHGFVAGGWCFTEAGYQSYVWAGQDTLVALGPAEALLGYPFAVAADGSVAVGVTDDLANVNRVYRWTEVNGLELIELPEGYTSSTLFASSEAMSEDGSVVVGSMDGTAHRAFLWSVGAGAVVLSPLEGHDISEGYAVSADGSVAAGVSRLGTEDRAAVYWRADGVAHRIADELAAHGVELGGGVLSEVRAAHAPLGFSGYGSKDEMSTRLAWRARLP